MIGHFLIRYLLLLNLLLIICAQHGQRCRSSNHLLLLHVRSPLMFKNVFIVAVLKHLPPLIAQPSLLVVVETHHADLLLLDSLRLLVVQLGHSAPIIAIQLHLVNHLAAKRLLSPLLLKPLQPLIVLKPLKFRIRSLSILGSLPRVLILRLLDLVESFLILHLAILGGEELSLVAIHHLSQLHGGFVLASINCGPLVVASRLSYLGIVPLVALDFLFLGLYGVFNTKRGRFQCIKLYVKLNMVSYVG